MKFICVVLVLAFGLSACSGEKPVSRFAFGSCSKETLEQPIWAAIGEFNPDVWIWMGDNVYGDTEDMVLMAKKYALQKSKPGYAKLRKSAEVIGTWDDHDYGVNNGGKEFPAKVGAQKALLDFLDVPEKSERRKQEGVYWTHDYGEGDQSVKVLLLDVRYHRDLPGSKDADVLGEAQWEWLEGELEESEAALNVIVSGIQVLHVDHRYEKWENFPAARERLLEASVEAQGRVIFLSGDRHISELAKLDYGDDKREFVEVTSSSLSHSWGSFPGEPNRYRVGEVYHENNFGTILVDWEREEAALQIRSEKGEVVRELLVGF